MILATLSCDFPQNEHARAVGMAAAELAAVRPANPISAYELGPPQRLAGRPFRLFCHGNS
jgi:hypothetical protein